MNSARGEIVAIVDDTPIRFCLTLGGLAELEGLLGCTSLNELESRVRRLTATEMRQVLKVLVCGDVVDCVLDKIGPCEAARVIGEAFHAALV